MQNQNKWETEMNQTHFYKQPNFKKSSLCFHLITRLALSGSNLMQKKKKRALLEHNNCKLLLTHFFKKGGGSGDQEAVIRKLISNQKILSEQ